MSFFSKTNLLTDKQFGFRNNHSTYMPIMLIQDLITKSLEESKYVAGIYLDLCKAFDTVDRNILINKLDKYGIKGKAIQILESYLSDCTQTVSIGGTKST